VLSRVLLGDDHERARAVGDRAGVVEVERLRDRWGVQRLLDGHFLAVLSVLVGDRVRVVLRGDVGQIPAAPAVRVEVGGRHQRVRAGERHSRSHLEQVVGGDSEPLGHLVGWEVCHALHPAGQHHVGVARGDGPDGLAHRDAGRGTRLLVAGRGAVHAGRLGHQRRLMALVLGE